MVGSKVQMVGSKVQMVVSSYWYSNAIAVSTVMQDMHWTIEEGWRYS